MYINKFKNQYCLNTFPGSFAIGPDKQIRSFTSCVRYSTRGGPYGGDSNAEKLRDAMSWCFNELGLSQGFSQK